MAFRIKRTESVQHAIRRIAGEQISKAIAEIDDPQLDRHTVVHQIRKRCKKLRGLLRLVRPALGKTYAVENKVFRNAARPLSATRDASSILGTYQHLLAHFENQVQAAAFASISEQLRLRRDQQSQEEIETLLSEFRAQFLEARGRVDDWKLSATGCDAILGGLAKTHRRARGQLDDVLKDPTAEDLHALRKRIKYHWYHSKLLRSLWPAMFKVYSGQLNSCSEQLGSVHDLDVLRATILQTPDEFGTKTDIEALIGLLDRHSKQLQESGLSLGQRLFAEPSDALALRVESYWKQWRR